MSPQPSFSSGPEARRGGHAGAGTTTRLSSAAVSSSVAPPARASPNSPSARGIAHRWPQKPAAHRKILHCSILLWHTGSPGSSEDHIERHLALYESLPFRGPSTLPCRLEPIFVA